MQDNYIKLIMGKQQTKSKAQEKHFQYVRLYFLVYKFKHELFQITNNLEIEMNNTVKTGFFLL